MDEHEHTRIDDDDLTLRVRAALSAPGCERLQDFYNVGPTQRAALEQFVVELTRPVPSLMSSVKLPLYQAAQWNMAVQCAEREPHKQAVLEGRTILAVHAKLTDGVSETVHTDHPARHYDRTCPACNAGMQPDEISVDDYIASLTPDEQKAIETLALGVREDGNG